MNKASVLAIGMIKDFTDNPSGHKALGRLNLTQRNFDTAVANLEKALELFTGDQDIYINLSRAYVSNEQLIKARDILKNGLAHVNDTSSLQRELIDLVRFDNNFVSGHHFANQLKLNERTKAEGYMLQGDLYLLENKRGEAINAVSYTHLTLPTIYSV